MIHGMLIQTKILVFLTRRLLDPEKEELYSQGQEGKYFSKYL